jgi:hypothetical protein
MNRLSSATRIGEEIVHQLVVSAIYLVDSSSITLRDGACESYRRDAHACGHQVAHLF